MNEQKPLLVVQKYGGTSLATVEKIRLVATKVAAAKAQLTDVVVVVSAMGQTTNELLALAKEITAESASREIDMLIATGETVSAALMALALRTIGCQAVALSGDQAGIATSAQPGQGEIVGVDEKRLLQLLAEGIIPVVAGFQGRNEYGDMTTLGRGGSDTTAVALAAAINADRCEIYTDVPGVMSTDPRMIPEARILTSIDYHEMLELSATGAKVMHPRAVELGEREEIPIWVGSTFGDEAGTTIQRVREQSTKKVQGIACDPDVAKMTLLKIPDHVGIAGIIFGALAEKSINIDIIVQNVGHDGSTDVSFTLAQSDLPTARTVLTPIVESIGGQGIVDSMDLAKVSVVGSGIRGTPGVFAAVFSALAAEGINIIMISTSEIYLACIIERSTCAQAVQALHTAFALGEDE